MQLGGCYFKKELLPAQPYRIFNTFLGDPLRAAQLAVIAEVIERDHLLENTQITGQFLLEGLRELQERFSGVVTQARGVGTFCAFDLPNSNMQNQMVVRARQLGLEIGGSGTGSIRFRPALCLRPRHVVEAISILAEVCRQL